MYFESKLDLLYAVYEPWMRSRIMLLEEKLKGVDSPFDGLRLLLRMPWKEIPAEENGFIDDIVQALSTAGAHDEYNPSLLDWMEERINAVIFGTLPPARRRVVYETRLAHMLVMALDGYAIHNHINPRGVADEQTNDAMARLLPGEAPVRSRRKPGFVDRVRSTRRLASSSRYSRTISTNMAHKLPMRGHGHTISAARSTCSLQCPCRGARRIHSP